MSKNINVNPNYYKTGGREHAEGDGEGIPYEQEKQQLAKGKKNEKRNFIPGAAPVGQPERGGRKR